MCMSMMSVDVLRVCVVLQDSVDQMSVLMNIMRTAADTKSISSLKTASQGLKDECSLSNVKTQSDRQFVSDIFNSLILELQETNSCQSLIKAVEDEKMKKAQLLHTINSVEESSLKIKGLQKQLHDIRKEKTEECKSLEESIDHLRHQLQTTRVKSEWQRTFVKSSAQQMICQGQKMNTHKENKLDDELGRLQEESEEEKTVYMMMEDFLKRQHTILQEKMQFWMKRYEKDMEEKKQELTSLQNKKAKNLVQLHELSRKCRDMQQVIIEDRTEKEQLRVQLETEQRQRDAVITIQSWWRGTLVRRGLGFKKKAKKSKPKKAIKKKK